MIIESALKSLPPAVFLNCNNLAKLSIFGDVKSLGQAIIGCPVEELHYNGTKEQWKTYNENGAITRFIGIDSTVVYCTDGIIKIEE